MENNLEQFRKVDLLVLFKNLKPSLKFNSERNILELNKLIKGFLDKVEESNDDLQMVYLSIEISNSNINDKMKVKLLKDLNIIMYKLHNNKVLKAELEEIGMAVQGIL
ncbi:MAG: hypothetical protein PHS49_03805 [Candidatus Gracilibacteria bacterium]|nr:hypothetical protein [Candidatus Gracilibacteria bacterium]